MIHRVLGEPFRLFFSQKPLSLGSAFTFARFAHLISFLEEPKVSASIRLAGRLAVRYMSILSPVSRVILNVGTAVPCRMALFTTSWFEWSWH
jgi:hypothetical protein